jgi:hypothetical protein
MPYDKVVNFIVLSCLYDDIICVPGGFLSFSLNCIAKSRVPAEYEALIKSEMPEVVAWRQDFHQNPELGNREFNALRKGYRIP